MDFHTHSIYSGSHAFASPEQMVSQAKVLGLDAIALTDHNTCEGLPRAQKQAEREGLMLIPGVEIAAEECGRVRHVIGLGLWEDGVPMHQPLDGVVEWIHSHGGIAVAPHPFYVRGVDRRAGEMDAIEVHNAWGDRIMDRRAELLANRLSKPRLAGSDAHTWTTLGYGATWVDSDRSVRSVIRAVCEGKTQIRRRQYVSFREAYGLVDTYHEGDGGWKVKVLGTMVYALFVSRNLCGLAYDHLLAMFSKA